LLTPKYCVVGHWWNRTGEEGIALMREGVAAYRMTRANLEIPHWLALLAEGLRRAGLIDEALDVRDGSSEIDRTGIVYYKAEMSRLEGESYGTSDDGRSEACFLRALEIARGQKAKSWELRAVVRLARLWRNRGKGREARDLLATTVGWFSEGFDTGDRKDAKTLLDELAV
jgi:predicted ATPase